jgi:transposase
VRACYEAGPLGYALQRELESQGVICEVVAPSLIPIKPGERIKTDWRDARKLAELLRSEMLTAVPPPNEADEALRDLCRGRDSVRQDLMRARHRMSKFLLRRGYRYHAAPRGRTAHDVAAAARVRTRGRTGDLRSLPADNRPPG